MALIAVVSDTHGSKYNTEEFLAFIRKKPVDYIIHLGDNYEDADLFIEQGYAVIRVPGTWTAYYQNPTIENRFYYEESGWHFFLSHTPEKHKNDLKSDPEPLSFIKENKVDVFFYGHTHVPKIQLKNNTVWFNPGFLKDTKNINDFPTFGLLEVTTNILSIKIIDLATKEIYMQEQVFKGPEPRKALSRMKPYKPGKSIQQVAQEFGVSKLVKMASNENPMGSAIPDINNLIPTFKNIHYYPSYSTSTLLAGIAKKFQVSADNIILGNGSDEIITMIAMAYLNPGDEVITAEHTFSQYEFVTNLMDAKLKAVPMVNYKFAPKEILKSITDKTKLVFIANPNNPTGTYINNQELDYLLTELPANIILIMDEAYFEYASAADYPNSLNLISKYPNLVTLRTFSKIYGLAGFRIGYGFSNKTLINNLGKVRQPFNINSIAEAAASQALNNEEHVQKSLKLNEAGKMYLYEQLEKLGLKFCKTEANFIFIETPKSADFMFREFINYGLIIRSLTSFGFPNAVRVTVGQQHENEVFINALKNILRR